MEMELCDDVFASTLTVSEFLDKIIKSAKSGNAAPAKTKRRLATSGSKLIQHIGRSTSATKQDLTTLQMQVIAHLLVCCAPKLSKLAPHKEQMRKEVRRLLDLVALQGDVATPAQLVGEDRPPFHTFMIDILATKLEMYLPKLFQCLRRKFEIETEDQQTPPAIQQVLLSASQEEEAADKENVGTKRSILSALRDENPRKRCRIETDGILKEVRVSSQQASSRRTISPPSLTTKVQMIASTPSREVSPKRSPFQRKKPGALANLSPTSDENAGCVPKDAARNVKRKGLGPSLSQNARNSNLRPQPAYRKNTFVPDENTPPAKKVVQGTPEKRRPVECRRTVLVAASPPWRMPTYNAQRHRTVITASPILEKPKPRRTLATLQF